MLLRYSRRLSAPLVTGLAVVSLVIIWKELRTEQLLRRVALEQRAESMAGLLQDRAEPLLQRPAAAKLRELADAFVTSEHLAGAAIHDVDGKLIARSAGIDEALEDRPAARAGCVSPDRGCGELGEMNGASTWIQTAPLHRNHTTAALLTTYHDARGISMASPGLWLSALAHATPPILLLTLTTIGIVQLMVLRPIVRTAQWMRDLRTGLTTGRPILGGEGGLLDPIFVEAAGLVRSLVTARASAAEEARLRAAGDSCWTAERLRIDMEHRLGGSRLFVVSNREPYAHVQRGKTIAALVPASGLVTALEPILCACDGTWIAHGSGDADRNVVDEAGRVRVPPEEPRYTLRRVWLSREEQQGYYVGFANEGLWPLCHIAHTRPIFRSSDWLQYQIVNRRFADAVLQEIDGTSQPFVLVQDYHFALLPRLVKEARPDARIAVFWHIPWPNPEAFGICPWQRELLDGLLGADVVSFHIQAHCTNFLQTIDRALECRIEWERFAVNRRHHSTVVRAHPISVAFPDHTDSGPAILDFADGDAVRREFGLAGTVLAVGVDRVDYTKGIMERFRATEHLLDAYPTYRERFTLAQVGAPSRMQIKRYQDLLAEVEAEAQRINRRFQRGDWKPIVLFSSHHGHDAIRKLYRAADVCLVTSLHDGMNLVAKEFVASREDEDGVLILSQFAGAASELRDALVVNPYDIEQLADTIRAAIEMPLAERRHRMHHLRRVVREHNVYRWASDLIADLSEVRPEAATTMAAAVF
jgi:trehalose 6-phosphate synthase